MFKPPPLPPPVLPRRTALSDQRQTGCTHMQMTRIFDADGLLECSLCHKHPGLGWLYRCSQDSDGFLPYSDFASEEVGSKKLIVHANSLNILSPPIVQAIGDGQYTEEQIKTLIHQKEQVRDVILGQDMRPTTATSSTVESSTFSSFPRSTTFSTNSSTSLDEELRAAYDWSELQKVWLSEPTTPPDRSSRPALELKRRELTDEEEHGKVIPCTIKVCPTCRPTYRERAFQSLDGVMKNPMWPPQWELGNRRVSDAVVLLSIGLPKLSRFCRRSSPGNSESNNSLYNLFMRDELSYEQGNDQHPNEFYTHSVRRRSGFRETVRKALKRAQTENFPTSNHNLEQAVLNNDSATESSHPLTPSTLFMRRKSKANIPAVEPRSRVVQSNGIQDPLMLLLASNTTLPQGPRTPLWSADDLGKIDRGQSGAGDLITQT